MPVASSKLQTLALLSNLRWPSEPYLYPVERDISREALVDVAPDREDLLANSGVEEIRQALKLRVNLDYG